MGRALAPEGNVGFVLHGNLSSLSSLADEISLLIERRYGGFVQVTSSKMSGRRLSIPEDSEAVRA